MNNTPTASSGNASGCYSPANTATKLVLTAAYSVIVFVALFGNCAIIFIAKTKKRIRKVAFNFFIISMAIADIMDALIAVPLTVIYFFIGDLWFGGLIGTITCKIAIFLNILSLAASILTLVAITVDRYLAIVHVLREPLSKRQVKVGVVSTWLFASLLSSPYLIKYKSQKLAPEFDDGQYHCFGYWVEDIEKNFELFQYENTIRVVLMYVVPLFLMAFLYSLIIHVLRKRQAFGENMSQLRIQRQNVTVIKMLVTVVLLFALCWFPVSLVSIMVSFAFEKIKCWPMALVFSLYLLSHANGAINPCIYLIFNENYRKGLRELITRCRTKAGKRIPTKRIMQWPGSSTLEHDPSRGGIKGYFRHLSREKNSDSTDVHDTRL